MAVRQLLGRWSRTCQAEQLLDGRAAPLLQHLRSFHTCRWLAAEAQPQAPAPAIPMSTELHAYDEEDADTELTPKQVVAKLDRYIVGQADAKRAVANALRNRWRRHRIDSPMKEEIVPKNILMIGPTGCGKTEIARRLAKLADAPFVKVEATKFTEVGFHGRDVDQIVRDLVDAAIIQTRARLRRRNRAAIAAAVEERILDAVLGTDSKDNTREAFRELYRARQMEERKIKVEVAAARPGLGGAVVEGMPNPAAMQAMLSTLEKAMARSPGASQLRELTIAEARPLLEEAETERLVTSDSVTREAVAAVEADGIVFIDEIDKIVINHELRYGADASSEGVQRDLLPIIEGSVVSTKYGNVATDHILFICSGAFHSCKPSDMLAELQGRLPIRVELKGLTKEDFIRILTEPENNMIRQQQALLATEGIDLHFTEDAIQEVARVAEEVNSSVDNIGARRLHTVLERILEEISFEAPERVREAAEGGSEGRLFMAVDKELVAERVGELLKKQDLSKYVL